jgi:hypothetical protein
VAIAAILKHNLEGAKDMERNYMLIENPGDKTIASDDR